MLDQRETEQLPPTAAAQHVVLMVQSPLDVPVQLEYVFRHPEARLTIIVVGTRGVFDYLKALELDAEVIFVQPVLRSGSAVAYLQQLREQRAQLRELVPQVDEIRYGSEYQDLVTACFVEAHRHTARIVKVATEIDALERFADPLSVRDRAITAGFTLVLRLVLGLRVTVFRLNGQLVFQHIAPYAKRVDYAPSPEMFARYGRTLAPEPGVNILLFESNGQDDRHFVNYEPDLRALIEMLQRLGTVYVKPHPSRGYSRLLAEAGVRTVAAEVPASLLQPEHFAMVVGIDTAALREIRHPRVVSVIDSFSFRSGTGKKQIKAYLRQGNGKDIVFKRTEELIHGI